MQNFLHYLTFPYLLQGCLVALGLLFGALVGGLLIGFVLALGADARWIWVRYPVRAYIYLIRGTPQLLQLILLFNVLPQAGLTLTPFVSALLALTINETAFCAEIIRGGIRSVNRDQRIAAQAFGFSALTELAYVVIPQGLRAIIPALGNEAVGLLKSTSLASVVGVSELTLRSQTIVSQNFEFLPVLLASGVMYIVLSAVIAGVQNWCERNVGTGRRVRAAGADAPLADDAGQVGRMAPHEGRATPGVPQLEIDAVRVRYGSRDVLKDVSLSVAPGEVVALLGKSGSGKSTLLKTILALNPVESGAIRIDGRSLTSTETGAPLPRRRLAKSRAEARIGMVFQNFALFDHLSAVDNAAAIPLRVQHVPHVEASRRARIALLKVGLKDFSDHMPHEMSGGQQQRVGIARALASDPRVILLDEPTSALDPELVGEVDETIRRLAQTGITMLLSTHDINFAASVADRVVFLHDGRIIEQGPPSILRAPATAEFAAFLRHPDDDKPAPAAMQPPPRTFVLPASLEPTR
ncbi:amino acid ABC transporter permease/ATP-binding protein [Burkholderia sp. Ac-20379]|uniref:amino acid ABC transporter permease/ATP-binding protein n=1 Tax=Burkholderia sp. Ac-20379 TaxID=2703900 RepID=UPI00197EE9D6|nr:amino acid ABC transporter permease/ATP-binding protein [Burkholderia sp. Ac-20379]MBN3727517.1 amino acid ABC transporter permease/ATP-binding protein [Burkholderia sp. Ac-20379]